MITFASHDLKLWNSTRFIKLVWFMSNLFLKWWTSSIQSAKTRPGNDCGSDHELLIAKFKLKLKNKGKNTRPFRYDLNQIPHDYTVEVTNRFKGFYLTECQKNYGWRFTTVYRRRWLNTIPKKKKSKKANWLSEEALEIAEKRREVKAKEKRTDTLIWMQSYRD